ncbi:MAG: hypothetical protein L6R36_009309, partial [Xanthoria steineri]
PSKEWNLPVGTVRAGTYSLAASQVAGRSLGELTSGSVFLAVAVRSHLEGLIGEVPHRMIIFVDSSMYAELRLHSMCPSQMASHLPTEASTMVHYYPGALHSYTSRALTTDEGTYSCALRIQPPGIEIPQPAYSAVDKGGLTRQTNSSRGLDMDPDTAMDRSPATQSLEYIRPGQHVTHVHTIQEVWISSGTSAFSNDVIIKPQRYFGDIPLFLA